MTTIQGPLNLNYGSYQSTAITGPIFSESVTFTFNKVTDLTGGTKAPYFNILQALLGVNGVNGPGTQENIYIGIHEPGSVFDGVVYTHGAVDMAIWDTSVKANPANGSIVGNWYDGGNNQRFLNGDVVNLVDGAVYTVGMEVKGDTVTGYVINAVGARTDIGSFSGLSPAFQGFKNRIITELEFTSSLDSSRQAPVSTSVTNVAFNGSTDNVRLFYVSHDSAAGSGTAAGTQITKAYGDTYFETSAGAGANVVSMGADSLTVVGGGANSVLKLTPEHADLTKAAITFVPTLDMNHRQATMRLATLNAFKDILNSEAGVVLNEKGILQPHEDVTTYIYASESRDNTVAYQREIGDYAVRQNADGTVSVTSATGKTDTIGNAARLHFADKSVNLAVGKAAKTISEAQLDALIELYIAYINRTPDADGMQYWINELKNGKNLDEIGESFYTAALQYANLTGYFSGMENEDFVRTIYRNVLGRTSVDAAGLDYWTEALARGAESRGSLVSTILASAHTFKGDATWGHVADLLDNKISVGKTVAIRNGIVYNTDNDTVAQGMAIASAITASDMSSAIKLIGVSGDIGLY